MRNRHPVMILLFELSVITYVERVRISRTYGSSDAPPGPMAVMLLAAAAPWLRIVPTGRFAEEPGARPVPGAAG